MKLEETFTPIIEDKRFEQEDEQLNEIFALVVWAGIRYTAKAVISRKLINEFFDKYDPNERIQNETIATIKEIKSARSLEDIKRIEREAESHFKEIEDLTRKVDQFVDEVYRDKPNWADRLLFTKPQKTKRDLKKYIEITVNAVRDKFEKRARTLEKRFANK